MTCPVCGANTKVVNSRKDCESVYRRRVCLECDYSFYTTETESKGDDLKAICRDKATEYRKRGKRK